MAYAVQLHQQGRLLKAQAIYRQIVERQPDHADAQHLLGVTYHQTGKQEQAYSHISQAILLNSNAALFHNNLGEVCRALNRLDEAQACYSRALSLQPELLEAQRNVGLTLIEQNMPEEAVNHLRQVVAHSANFPGAYWALGAALMKQQKLDEALEVCSLGLETYPLDVPLLCAKGLVLKAMQQPEQAILHYRQAIKLQPLAPDLYQCLSGILKQSGDVEGAIECLKTAVQLRPNYGTAQHLLASLQNITTDRAPATYVSELFDSYADSFDQHLVGTLEYRTPSILAHMLSDAIGSNSIQASILDLGCGTGLFGEAVKNIKKRLVGIDLAPKMIQKAEERGLYDKLIAGDLLEYMAEVKSGEFDLVAAADVFNYVGNLQSVFEQVARILPVSGWFVFSLEAAPEGVEGFALNKTGRYQHGRLYVPRLCKQYGFDELCFAESVLRRDGDKPVVGYLYLLKKSG
jgi:predicted TPR repeat methyltransferase